MLPFHTDTWIYDPANPANVLRQLPRELLHTGSIETLLCDLHTRGGKALGLTLCERIAEGSPSLQVPPWICLPAGFRPSAVSTSVTDWINRQSGGIKVRSSTRYEDWIAGEAGEEDSRSVLNPERALAHAYEISHQRHSVVLQTLVSGIGVVVDIAYSQILDQPIVRISTGREDPKAPIGNTFSSATTDHEGRHEVLDPETGRPVIAGCVGDDFTGSCLNLPIDRIARALWVRVQELGIRFAVQFELMIHPSHPNTWWLVQVRPVPNHLRANGKEFRALPEALVTTPAVSRPFSISTIAGLAGNREAQWLRFVASGGVEFAQETLGYDFRPDEVLVWEKDPDSDYALWQLEAGFKAGAHVQVTRRVLLVSTSHNRIKQRLESEQGFMTQAGVIALPDAVHRHVVDALRAGPRTITAISDGFVGQIVLH